MKKHSYFAILKPFLKRPFFKAEDARKKGIPSNVLSYYCKRGIIERVSRGLYKSPTYESKVDFPWEDFALITASIPEGVICLISALTIYELTDQIMREYWIAIPYHIKPPKRPHLRIVRMRNMGLGRKKMKLGEHKVNIFDRERTIVDAFRLLSKEVAIKALQAYLSHTGGYKPDLRKLQKYAKMLRVDLTPYVLTLTT